MSLTEIITDAVYYPFSNITNFLIVGVLTVLASFSSIATSFGIEGGVTAFIAAIISFVFAFVVSGYSVDVIRKGIEQSNDFPDIDLKENFINGIKAVIIEFIYMLIPIIIAFVLMVVFGVVGAGINHVFASLGLASFLIVIIFVFFAVFEMVALARFAKTRSFGEALNIGAVIEDVKRIGILKIIAFVIIVLIISLLVGAIIGLFTFIPYIGVIIATLVLGAFALLFTNKALGLLYAEA